MGVCVAVSAVEAGGQPASGHDLWEVFNGLRYMARTGCQWRWMPGDLPPWAAVSQQTRRWMAAGCFEALVADVQSILREWKGQPTAVCIVAALAEQVQKATGSTVELAYVDQGYTGLNAAEAAQQHGIC